MITLNQPVEARIDAIRVVLACSYDKPIARPEADIAVRPAINGLRRYEPQDAEAFKVIERHSTRHGRSHNLIPYNILFFLHFG
jgi:hypothetical protein